MTKGGSLIMRIYFALVSAVTLFVFMFGLIDILRIGMKTYIFTAADVPTYLESCDGGSMYAPATDKLSEPNTQISTEQLKAECNSRNAAAIDNYRRQKADAAVRNLAMIMVSLPLFIGHFSIVYRDWRDERKSA
jgi:hypothetical protein